MFFLISGAAASGKSTMARLLKEQLHNVECHDYDERTAATAFDRCRILEDEWIREALAAQSEGKDFLLSTHSPLGELLAAPSAVCLDGISCCLLDCHDFERVRRYRGRPGLEDWPLSQGTLSWASWMRLLASDPQWEQHVIVNSSQPGFEWKRWTNWAGGDKRWRIGIIDSTDRAKEETLALLLDWIIRVKDKESALSAKTRWWSEDNR